MPKIVACLLLFAFVLLSCKREKWADVPEPLKAIITNTKDCACEPYIDKYLWRNQTVYLSSCGGPTCDCLTVYYDEAGKEFKMDSGYYPDQFRQEAQLIKHVWRCKP
jgi:hypothetical protein